MENHNSFIWNFHGNAIHQHTSTITLTQTSNKCQKITTIFSKWKAHERQRRKCMKNITWLCGNHHKKQANSNSPLFFLYKPYETFPKQINLCLLLWRKWIFRIFQTCILLLCITTKYNIVLQWKFHCKWFIIHCIINIQFLLITHIKYQQLRTTDSTIFICGF